MSAFEDRARLHEEGFIRGFISPARKGRYLFLLEKGKRRAIAESLDHFADLDPKHCVLLPPKDHVWETIHSMLVARGAPGDCYLMSSDRGCDNQFASLREALQEIVGSGIGTLISCVPVRVAYFEGEERGERYILYRKG